MRSGILLALVMLAGCTANQQKNVARDAASAMTGSPETLTAVASLTMEGHGTGLDFTIASFTTTTSYKRAQWKHSETRVSAKSVEVQRSGMDGKAAYVESPDGTKVPLPEEQTRRARAQLFHHPLGFLLAVFSKDAPASNMRTEAGMDAVDITVDGVVYSLYLDGATKLPSKITSKSGAAVTESSFSEYVNLHGYRLPSRIVTTLNGEVITDITITQQFAGPDLGI